MNYTHKLLLSLLGVFCFSLIQVKAKAFSPIDFGLLEARNGVERYEALLRCHKQALQGNGSVSYMGLDSIYLEIPVRANSIPLTEKTDFCGVRIIVKNQSKDIFLFTMEHIFLPINLTAHQIDEGDLTTCASLAQGSYIVIVEDKKPWVEERIGYGYPHIRKDILLVKNGRAKNRPVMPYNNKHSNPFCTYRKVSNQEKTISNLHFYRTHDSTKNTGLIKVNGEHNLKIKNVYVFTPSGNNMYGDRVIEVSNSSSVTYEDITVEGTYSREDEFGYAFSLNNVWNYTARRVRADANWGVYGTNNLNKVLLEKCKINRFDIHCYGRDVTMKKCCFFKLYNSFGATFGNIYFDQCIFDGSIPYLNAGSYNTFVKTKVIFNKCKFCLTNSTNFLVWMMGMKTDINSRPELSNKYLPDISLKRCEVNVPNDVNEWYLYRLGSYRNDLIVEGGNTVNVDNLHINGNTQSEAHLQTDKIELIKPINVRLKKVLAGGCKTVIK